MHRKKLYESISAYFEHISVNSDQKNMVVLSGTL